MAQNNTTLIGDPEGFNKTLDAAIGRIKELDKATQSSKSSVKSYASSFNKFADALKTFSEIKIDKNIINRNINSITKAMNDLSNIADKSSNKFGGYAKAFNKLASGIQKISDIKINNENIKNIKELNEVISLVENTDINEYAKSFNKIANGLSKLNGVVIDYKTISQLESINNILKDVENNDFSEYAKSFSKLANGLNKLNTVDIKDDTSTKIKEINEQLKDVENNNFIDYAVSVNKLANGLNKLNTVDIKDDTIHKIKELNEALKGSKNIIDANYVETLNKLSKELNRFNKLSKKGIGTKDTNKLSEEEIEGIKKENAKTALDKFGQVFNAVAGNTKDLSSYINIMSKGGKATSTAVKGTKALSSAFGAVSTTGAAVVGVLGLIVSALVAMNEAGRKAFERNIEINRSLMQMGEAADGLKGASVDTANKARDLSHQWTIIGQQLENIFQPVYEFFLNIAASFTDAVYNLTGAAGTERYNTKNTSGSASGYTSMLQSRYNEPESSSVPTINRITGTARQSGFDLGSAVNLAIGTYDAAFKIAQKYGLEASQVAEQLAAAWQNGSDAAKEYGVVVNDTVLAGYMADKGIDIVNVQITDAMKQYYRYQLMLEETNAKSQAAIQKQVKSWTQLGMQIEATKQKLFSFDEVIQLQALDTTIPVVSEPSIGPYESSDNSEGNGGLSPITPITPNGPGSNVPDELKVTADFPIPIPVEEPDDIKVENPVVNWGLVPDLSINWGLVPDLSINWGDVKVPIPVVNPVVDWVRNFGAVRVWTEQLNRVLHKHPEWVMSLTSAVQSFNNTVNKVISVVNPLVSSFNNVLNVFGLGKKETKQGSVVSASNVSQGFNIANADWPKVIQGINSLPIVFVNELAGGNLRLGDRLGDIASALSGYTLDKNTFINTYNQWAQPISTELDNVGQTISKFPINEIGQGVGVVCTAVLGLAAAPAVAPAVQTAAGTVAGKIGTAASSAALTIGNKLDSIKNGITALGSRLGGYTQPALSRAYNVVYNSAYSYRVSHSMGFASGGIGTHEISNATLFEHNKKEAVIPLESQAGIDYLANAMREAASNGNGGGSDNITINLSLSGIFDTDDRGKWERLAEKLAETITIQNNRRGGLNYGASY